MNDESYGEDLYESLDEALEDIGANELTLDSSGVVIDEETARKTVSEYESGAAPYLDAVEEKTFSELKELIRSDKGEQEGELSFKFNKLLEEVSPQTKKEIISIMATYGLRVDSPAVLFAVLFGHHKQLLREIPSELAQYTAAASRVIGRSIRLESDKSRKEVIEKMRVDFISVCDAVLKRHQMKLEATVEDVKNLSTEIEFAANSANSALLAIKDSVNQVARAAKETQSEIVKGQLANIEKSEAKIKAMIDRVTKNYEKDVANYVEQQKTKNMAIGAAVGALLISLGFGVAKYFEPEQKAFAPAPAARAYQQPQPFQR